MKNALISPNESPIQYVLGWTTDTPPQPIWTPIENSCRVAEVETQTFEVSLPLFWTPCADDVVADQWYYNTSDKEIYPVPEPAPYPPPSAEENKQTAIGLLSATDWATIPDVADPAISNPYLTNQQAYFDYRNIVRGYTINPVAGDINWPIQPEPIWSNT